MYWKCVCVCVCLYVCVIERERWRGKKGIDLLTDGVKRDRAKGSEGWDWVKEEWKWRGRARESKGRREAACICVGSVSHAWLLRTTLLLIVCALIWVHLTCSTFFFLSFFLLLLREAWTCREIRCMIHTYAESKELQWSAQAGKISFIWSHNILSLLFKACGSVVIHKLMINRGVLDISLVWLCSSHTLHNQNVCSL